MVSPLSSLALANSSPKDSCKTAFAKVCEIGSDAVVKRYLEGFLTFLYLQAFSLILDANILIRGVLGNRIEPLLEQYANRVTFLTVEEAFEDATKYVPLVIKTRVVMK
jgi:hypothetical protein